MIQLPADPTFPGPELTPADHARLGTQLERIVNVVSDGQWRTPEQLESETGYRWASISAQLRHLRKPQFGSHKVERRGLGRGLHEYRLVLSDAAVTGTTTLGESPTE